MAAIGVGAFLGAVGVAALGPSVPRGWVILTAEGVFSASLLVFAASRRLPLSLAALAVLGVSMVSFMATANTVL